MTIIELIKKFFFWLIELIKRLFKKKKKRKIKQYNQEKNIINNKKAVANINGVFDSTLPAYMLISESDKAKLIYGIGLLKNVLLEKNSKIIEEEEKELIALIEDKCGITVSEILDQKYIDTIVRNLDIEEREAIVSKYRDITKRDIEFKAHVDEIDKAIALINENNISIITESEIDREISDITNDKSDSDLDSRIDNFNVRVFDIIENFDKDFINEVVKEYKKVNYVTLTTTIIDKNYEQFKKLEEDFKNHRYNKYYYEREINRIKREINKVKNLKNNKEVNDHIMSLQKELYTKSKDKYDLLYNNEVFTNVLKECDNLLEKINAKVVDINKEKEIIEESEEKKREQKYVENILLRFQDMEYARALIRKALEEDPLLIYPGDLEKTIEAIYERFNNGIEDDFNFPKNKERTEYVILYNDLNRLISTHKKEEYYTIDHINFKVEDLAEAVEVKMDEVSGIMKKKNIYYDDTVTREKIELSNSKKLNNPMVLKKNSNNKKGNH